MNDWRTTPESSVGWLTEARDAIWAALDKCPLWQSLAAKGTFFRFTSGELLKRETLDRMPGYPVVAIGPLEARLAPLSDRIVEDERGFLGVQLVTDGQDAAPIERLLIALWTAIRDDWQNVTAVRWSAAHGQGCLHQIDFEQIAFSHLPGEAAARPKWLCTLRLALFFHEPHEKIGEPEDGKLTE